MDKPSFPTVVQVCRQVEDRSMPKGMDHTQAISIKLASVWNNDDDDGLIRDNTNIEVIAAKTKVYIVVNVHG